MCEKFLHFFINKVASARARIILPTSDPSDLPICSAVFQQFELVTLAQLQEVVDHLKPVGSPYDPIPPLFLKEVFSTIGPTILTILNSSLTSGMVPKNFKDAIVQPLLKKPGLDTNDLENFGPISKLPFLSNVLEKIVYDQLISYLNAQNVQEIFQSGFKAMHSTESAL